MRSDIILPFMAFRLIPREEKFFTDFEALADELKRGARLLKTLHARAGLRRAISRD